MRVLPIDLGDKEHPFPAAVVQYEYVRYPDWSAYGISHKETEWLGFSFYAKPDLSDRIVGEDQNRVEVGPNKRVLLYRGQPHILNIDEGIYLLGMHLPWPRWQCWIVRIEVEAQR